MPGKGGRGGQGQSIVHLLLPPPSQDGPAPYPLPLRAAAAAVLDSHQRLFYPSPAARQAFLAELLGGEAEGATLEVQVRALVDGRGASLW